MEFEIVKIHWIGYNWDSDLITSTSEEGLFIFQVYGQHPIYGKDILLYLGLADYSLSSVTVIIDDDYNKIDTEIYTRYYIGRINKPIGYNSDKWNSLISSATKALIICHRPVYNVSIDKYKKEAIDKYLLIENYEDKGMLLPSVTNCRWNDAI